jgi:hypothetical protein
MASFDENGFINKFKLDYYKDTHFNFDISFQEYFRIFVENNTDVYNRIIFRYLYNKYRIKWSEAELTLHDYIYMKLYQITKEEIMK